MKELLNCRQITKKYQEGRLETLVLDKVSLSLLPGDFTAIVGASGSGKSTLLHILGALDHPDSGDVHLFDQSLFQISSQQQAKLRNQHLGFVYQFHHLLADFSALENVAMPLLIAKEKTEQAKALAKEMLTKVGLEHRLAHRPSELSGGERQRVAIARALVNQPSLVLADEPTGNLDQKTAIEIYDLMRQLNEDIGTAFLVVTHDKELAQNMDKQLLMKDGQLVEQVDITTSAEENSTQQKGS